MKEIVCNGCALLCDDVAAYVNGKEVQTLGLCRLGHAHLESALNHSKNASEDEESIKIAAEIIGSAESPLLFGLSRSSNETIEAGLKLAKKLNAAIASNAEMGISQALDFIKLEADLEHARNFGEFIIYWGSDPTESSHRHPSRFAVLPRGEKIPEGIESRTIGVVDVRETETMKMANYRLIIPPGKDAELLEAITWEVSGESSITGPIAGIQPGELISLVKKLKVSDCTTIFYGSGVLNSGQAAKNLAAMSNLVNAIRSAGKEAFALPMAHESNIIGATKALKSRGTLKRLVHGEYDACLVVGNDPLAELPGPSAKAMAKTRLIYIGPKGTITGQNAELAIHSIDDIIAGTGKLLRLDELEVGLKPLDESSDKSLTELGIITRIADLL